MDSAHTGFTNKLIVTLWFFKSQKTLFSLTSAKTGPTVLQIYLFILFSDVLALPIFKQEDSSLPQENETKHPPFQYVMCAATSPAVKLYDETLTYLNQGWYTYVAGITIVNVACGASRKLKLYFEFLYMWVHPK